MVAVKVEFSVACPVTVGSDVFEGATGVCVLPMPYFCFSQSVTSWRLLALIEPL